MVWTPRVTVAAVVEQDGRFLLVEELEQGRSVYNQPAGHLEDDEGLIAATVRETLEETGRHFVPEALVGIYRLRHEGTGLTFIRVAITGQVSDPVPGHHRDPDILDTHWLHRDALIARPETLRSPLVLRCIDDYLSGQRYPLDLLTDLPSIPAV
ncbi:ADP-ribose pyrophosphatase YjhB, NUDIX family [Ectothiorhodospira magna]|uniref:Phosphatase NudJ n=1 Tax=Ectothiorhodospira magna TaxID=867345 RepID=A0A1H9A513_9GAMM|nr:NUDIX hydrolase [Ectothiorhodospira magna]SEP71577.1 ADP-ribose pyrophosphatase YjhB, NUDIX family [Ectothiorhodospira magna]